MVVGIGLTAIFVPLPREFVKAGDVLGIILLLAAALFVLLVLRKPKDFPDENRLKVSSGWKLIDRTRSLVERLIVGFRTIGLALFGVEKILATGFSVVVFFILTLPLWLIGFFALAKSGMTLSTMKNQLKTLRRHREAIS